MFLHAIITNVIMKRKSIGISIFLFCLILLQMILFSPEELEVRNPREFLQVDEWDESVQQNLEGILLVESENQKKMWEVQAESAKAMRESNSWEMKKADANFFSEIGVVYRVQAEETFFEANKKDMSFKKNVIVTSSNGYNFQTESLSYSTEKKSLVGVEPVHFEGFGNSKNEMLKMTGEQIAIDLESGLAQLMGGVKSQKYVSGLQEMDFSSSNVVFSSGGGQARFEKNVVVHYEDMTITGSEALIFYEPDTKEVKSVNMQKGAKLDSTTKKAVAGSLSLDLKKESLILEDRPRLLQKGDELIGTRFIFRNKGKNLEVQGAKAHLNTESSGTVLDE